MSAPKLNKNHYKHGLSHTRIDNIYKSMVSRCYKSKNIHFDTYGGRGIRVCQEWLEDKTLFFKWAFNNGYRDNLTLDRINVNKGYEPTNCRWITYKEQCNNKRNNRIITFNGTSHTLSEWSDISGIRAATLFNRLKLGWSIERTLTTKVRKSKNGENESQ